MTYQEFLRTLDRTLDVARDETSHVEDLQVVVEVQGQQYPIRYVTVEWNLVPEDRLVVIEA